MSLPKLELDERFFVILAQAEGVALSQHKITGSLDIWRLDWKCSGRNTVYQANEAATAWAQYMKEAT